MLLSSSFTVITVLFFMLQQSRHGSMVSHVFCCCSFCFKERKETQRCDKSHMCPDHPRCATPTKVVMWGGVPDVVNHARFCKNWLRGFSSLRVKICHFPMFSAMAYITVQGYRPTCDYHIQISAISVTLDNIQLSLCSLVFDSALGRVYKCGSLCIAVFSSVLSIVLMSSLRL